LPRFEVRIAGFGGQGIVKAGAVLGKALSNHTRRNVTMTESYGATIRGGLSKAEIVMSESPVDYPKVEKANTFIAMSQQAYDEYRREVRDGGIIIIDSTKVQKAKDTGKVRVCQIPASKMAKDLGTILVANIILLGVFTAITDLISKKEMEGTLAEEMPPSAKQWNLEAFRAGYSYV